MNKKLILHIPHSSTIIPQKEDYTVEDALLEKEMLKLNDWYTDELFASTEDISVVAPFSRIFCDAERFADDSQEVMAKYGMGALYEKCDNGQSLRSLSPSRKTYLLKTYYWKHHQKLSAAVKQQLDAFGKATILDCHSFPSKALFRDLDQRPNRPDFTLGTDAFHTSKELLELSTAYFEKKGFSLGIDWPYKGSIVPLEYYQKNKQVSSIMLEVNRALYLNEPGNEKSASFAHIQKIVQEFMQELRQSL